MTLIGRDALTYHAPMRIDVLTLFPEMFVGVLDSSILRRAAADLPAPDDPDRVRRAVVSYHVHNIRDHSADAKHAKVDSPPYGGGPGMVMQCQPVWDAVQAVTALDPAPPRRLLTTPKGRPLTQQLCEELAAEPRLMILAGHYEGLDQRVIDRLHEDDTDNRLEAAGASPSGRSNLLEISVGDYVLSGGELPAMTIIDAVVRLLPGALGHADSARQDSFSPGVDRLLDHPHFTRPPQWAGRAVPDVLLGGNHAAIQRWRAERSRELTRQRRPDLLPGAAGASPSGTPTPTPGIPGAPGIPRPLLVTLRDAGPGDTDDLLALHAAAFPTNAESELVADLLAGHDVLFSILAECRNRIVGHALLSGMTHEDGGSVRGLVGLGPLAVDPDFQGQGLGSALVREAVRQCRDNRVTALFALGDPGFYQAQGFQPASTLNLSSDFTTAPGMASGDGGALGEISGGDAFQVILFNDRRPVPPGRVSYAPPFDRFRG